MASIRPRPPPLHLDEGDLSNQDLDHFTPPFVTTPQRVALPPSTATSPLRPELSTNDSSDSLDVDIRFRTTEPRTLYAGSTGVMEPEAQARFNAARRQSLVRPEDYLPPQHIQEPQFNPYQSPSWAAKPTEGFELDLASPYTSPKMEADIAAMPSIMVQASTPINVTPKLPAVEYDTLDSKTRMLGGKKVVKAGEWRRKLQLDAQKANGSAEDATGHVIIEKDYYPDEKSGFASAADVYLGKQPEPTTIALVTQSGAFRSACMKMAPFLLIVLHIANVTYLGTRLWFLIMTHAVTSANRQTYVRAGAWLFWLVEALYFWRFFLVSMKATFSRPDKKKLRIKGDAFLPTVDVLILCSGQHDQIVMDTAMAVSRLDWPVDRIRILVIDDTGSHELQRRIESYASHRALHLSYHRRNNKSSIASEKAALINFGLTETRMSGRQPGEYTLVLEADCLPELDILRAMLPHLLQNSRLALVRAEQGFYNVPSPVSATFANFLACVEPHSGNHSGFVMRRSAVDDVGGFPSETSIEDGQLAALLQGKGYQVKNLREVLQYGLVQDSWSTQMQQYLGRSLGPLRTARRLKFFIGNSRLQQMGIFARLSFMQTALAPFLSFEVFFCYLAYPAALLSGGFLLPALNMQQLIVIIRMLFFVNLLERLYEFAHCFTTGAPTHFKLQQRWTFISAYQIVGLFQALSPRFWDSIRGWRAEEGPRERDAKTRKSFARRLVSVFLTPGNLLHMAALLLMTVAVGYSIAFVVKPAVQHGRTLKQMFFYLLLTVFWPTMNWPSDIAAALSATIYVLFPPTVPSRDQMLIREPITGVARAAPAWRRAQPFKQTQRFEIACTLFNSLYVAALFAFTFWPAFKI